MNTAINQKFIEQKVSELEDKIDSFRSSNEFLRFALTMSMFHKYSYHNQIMILSQKPDATMVASFHTWKNLGRFVKRGERGIIIYVPVTAINENEDGEKIEKLLSFKFGSVFDVLQTVGKPLPEITKSIADDHASFYYNCLRLAEKLSVSVEVRDKLSYDGESLGNTVLLRNNSNITMMGAVLLHELAHEYLHKPEDRKTLDMEVIEIEAETVAYIVCSHFGIKTPSDKYLATWQSNHQIVESLKRISECCHKFIGELEAIVQKQSLSTR